MGAFMAEEALGEAHGVNGTILPRKPQSEPVTGLSYVVAFLSDAIRKARQRRAPEFFFLKSLI